jgi:hypothetical protein
MREWRDMQLNQLSLSYPPSFIYAATPARGSSGRGRRQRRQGEAATAGDEEEVQVYGCYAAVSMCDVR